MSFGERGTSVTVVGVGKLGAVIAGCYASKGFSVIGVDVNRESVESIRKHVPPVPEPGLQDLYSSCKDTLTATLDLHAAILKSDVSIILVPTPSEQDGGFSLRFLLPTCEAIGKALRERSEYHLVVVKSTVLPGALDESILPALERASGKRCGEGFGLCYNPEFIALGSIIRDFFHPDMVLIGESDPQAGERLEAVCRTVQGDSISVARMNFVNAELTKLAVNTYVTMKITYANLLARLCERLPESDVDVVTGALGRDKRIGSKYLRGALGYGGPCFPRDNAALASLARKLGSPFPLAEATDASNREQVARVVDFLRSKMSPACKVSVLGLSYKPDTDVVEESQGLQIAQMLAKQGYDVIVYDPAAMANANTILGDAVTYASSLEAAVEGVEAIVITTPWKEFEKLDLSILKNATIVLDCWRFLSPSELSADERYVVLGKGPERNRVVDAHIGREA